MWLVVLWEDDLTLRLNVIQFSRDKVHPENMKKVIEFFATYPLFSDWAIGFVWSIDNSVDSPSNG